MQAGTIEEIRKSIQSIQNYLESSDCSDKVHYGKQREIQDRKALELATVMAIRAKNISDKMVRIIDKNQQFGCCT